jgi:hypothetical protein
MKKIVLDEQPEISKETIANLTEEQLREIEGGAAASDTRYSCFAASCNTATASEVAEA